MRILFISHYFPPEVNAPASRTFEHCREWAGAGHDVTVITCVPNHPYGRPYPGYRNALFQRATIEGVSVIRVWTYLAANEGFTRRILNYLSFFVSAIAAAIVAPRFDVVVSTSPQFFCGLAGLVVRFFRRTPWVLEIRDLWPESIVAVGAMRPGFAHRALRWLEQLAYRKADRIVSVTDSFVGHIASRCGEPAKICVIKNGVDLAFFRRDIVKRNAVREALGIDHAFVAGYIGTHGMAHGLETVLEAAEILKDDVDIAFLFVGEGAERKRLCRLAKQMGLKNVHFLGQCLKNEMPGLWSVMDASLIPLRRKEAFKSVLPSKMFEAMAMGLPIILGVEGEACALLQEARAGLSIAPESPRDLADSIVKLAKDRLLARRLGENGNRFVRSRFHRSELAACYMELLREAAKPLPGPAKIREQEAGAC